MAAHAQVDVVARGLQPFDIGSGDQEIAAELAHQEAFRALQTKKGQQWFFGMKAHVVVDRDSGLVHTVVSTAANVADVTQAQKLLHGQEREVYADAGYTGADERAVCVVEPMDGAQALAGDNGEGVPAN